MTKLINSSHWKAGQSGNPNGRPPKPRVLTELLRVQGEAVMTVGGEELSGKEILARAVWQFVTTGEVMLAGRQLRAESVNDWAGVGKWLYAHVEPPQAGEAEQEPEMVVRIVHVDEDDE